MTNFEKWDYEFRQQNMFSFNHDANALLWLKVRAVCRGRLIREFCRSMGIKLVSTTLRAQNEELFNILENEAAYLPLLDDFLCNKSNEWYEQMGIDEVQLKEDLYKVKTYLWGGDKNNSLDKHLVSRYVKVISDYSKLQLAQAEIANNAWNYVQTSWFNNWTSYLIESLFKHHSRVISAVGEIKSVDFFIDDIPVDLKVTFFPNQYLNEKMKLKLGMGELAWLKREAKKVLVTVDGNQTVSQQLYTITERLKEMNRYDIFDELISYRKEVIDEAKTNPLELMEWLYSNQGEMRFGAENRLFVILADSNDMADSWKMKRAFNIIEPIVKQYLDAFSASTMKQVCFTFNQKQYKSLSDTIFVIK